MLVNKYPSTDFHELNLDWVISEVKRLSGNLTDFVKHNTIKYADPILWDITSQYEANTVVINGQTGDAYISTKPVPVGVSIFNNDYWSSIFNYEARLQEISSQITNIDGRVTELENRPETGTYKTVADLRASTHLSAGIIVNTAGYYAVNDGGGASYYVRNKVITDVETYDLLIIGDFALELMYDTELNILQLGAHNDNTVDASPIIEYAASKAIVYIPAGTYKIDNKMTFVTEPKIYGKNVVLNANTDDCVINIANTVDSRKGYIRDINIYQNGNGHCILFNGTVQSAIEFEITGCQFLVDYSGNNGWCIYADNDLSKAYINNCNFAGNGLYLKCFDANVITNCLFYGGANSTGVYYEIVADGVENNTIEHCVFTNAGYDIRIKSGEHIIIRNNQLENLSSGTVTLDPSALIYVEGTEAKPCFHIVIADNNIGANGFLNHGLYINHAKECVVENNVFASAVVDDIFLSAYSVDNFIAFTNETRDRVSSNPFQHLLITDNGVGNMGVLRNLILSVGGTASYYKDFAGMVHFVGGVYSSTLAQGAVIGVLPVGFRPSDTAWASGGNANEALNFKISFDGSITCMSPVTSQYSVYIGSFQAVKY